jgi:hypothetical protein
MIQPSKTTAMTNSIMTLKLPDSEPIQAALVALDIHAAALTKLSDEKAKLEKRIEDFFSSEDAVDQDPNSFAEVAGYRVRVESIPGIVERVKAKRYALADNLVSQIAAFERALAAEGLREREAVLDAIEAEIEARVPGKYIADGVERSYARLLAMQFPELASIPWLPSQFNARPISERPSTTWGDGEASRDQNFESVVRTARERAAALLSIRDRASRRGRFGLTLEEILQHRNDDLAKSRSNHQVTMEEDKIRIANGEKPIFAIIESAAAGV